MHLRHVSWQYNHPYAANKRESMQARTPNSRAQCLPRRLTTRTFNEPFSSPETLTQQLTALESFSFFERMHCCKYYDTVDENHSINTYRPIRLLAPNLTDTDTLQQTTDMPIRRIIPETADFVVQQEVCFISVILRINCIALQLIQLNKAKRAASEKIKRISGRRWGKRRSTL